MKIEQYIINYLIIINLLVFLVYGIDKFKAIRSNKNKRISRIPEKSLLFGAFVGGSFGALLAMLFFRHKIKKRSFLVKYFFVVLLQVLILLFLKII